MPGDSAVADPARAEKCREQREEDQLRSGFRRRSPSTERASSPNAAAACADEDAEEVERPQHDVDQAQRGIRPEHGMRRRTPGADREREHALLTVAVVGDDAPAAV